MYTQNNDMLAYAYPAAHTDLSSLQDTMVQAFPTMSNRLLHFFSCVPTIVQGKRKKHITYSPCIFFGLTSLRHTSEMVADVAVDNYPSILIIFFCLFPSPLFTHMRACLHTQTHIPNTRIFSRVYFLYFCISVYFYAIQDYQSSSPPHPSFRRQRSLGGGEGGVHGRLYGSAHSLLFLPLRLGCWCLFFFARKMQNCPPLKVILGFYRKMCTRSC